MLRSFTYLVFLVMALIFPTAVQAVPVSDLYHATIVVKDRDPDTRERAIAEAFHQVMVKASGSVQVPSLASKQTASNETVANQTADAAQSVGQLPAQSSLVQPSLIQSDQVSKGKAAPIEEHSDQIVPDLPAKLLTAYRYEVGGPGNQTLFLEASFDPAGVNETLEQFDLPVWPENRPLILVSLVIEKERRQDWISSDSDHPAVTSIKQYAQRRGLPTILPLMDLDEIKQISGANNPMMLHELLPSILARYQSDGLLLGHVKALPTGGYEGRWSLYVGQKAYQWKSNQPTLSGMVRGGIGQTAGLFAKQLSKGLGTESQEDEHLRLAVHAVNNIDNYAKVRRYLGRLSPIDQIKVSRIGEDRVIFDLEVTGGRQALINTLKLGHLLAPDQSTPDESIGDLRGQAINRGGYDAMDKMDKQALHYKLIT